MKNKDKPLTVKIVNDELIISIGISHLAYTTCHLENNNWDHNFKIDNEKEFAESIRMSLIEEDEAGNSFLTKLFDSAAEDVLMSGRLGCREATVKEKKEWLENYE
jgi:hypothetical protein